MRLFTTLLLLLICVSGQAQINRIDHLLISSPESKKLFTVFGQDFGLPVVWPFATWGSFSSGSVSLGNVVLEFVSDAPDQKQIYHGIALEPVQTAEKAALMLDSARISHGPPNNFPLILGEGKQDQGWTTMYLNQMLPESVKLFLCDYHDREHTISLQNAATARLNSGEGGLLGIEQVAEITIGCPETEDYTKELSKIPGIRKDGDLFTFTAGPGLRLIRSDLPFFGLKIKVKSLKTTRQKLTGLGYTPQKKGRELLLDDPIFGSRLVFFE